MTFAQSSSMNTLFVYFFIIIAPCIDIQMFNYEYYAMHKVQKHAGAISKLFMVLCLYGQ